MVTTWTPKDALDPYIVPSGGTISPIVPNDVVRAAWDVVRAALDGAATPEFIEGSQMSLAKWVLDQAKR